MYRWHIKLTCAMSPCSFDLHMQLPKRSHVRRTFVRAKLWRRLCFGFVYSHAAAVFRPVAEDGQSVTSLTTPDEWHPMAVTVRCRWQHLNARLTVCALNVVDRR